MRFRRMADALRQPGFLGLLILGMVLVGGPARATPFLRHIQTHGNAGPVSGLTRVHDVAVSPDGLHVYAAAQEADAVTVFARDAVTGVLSFVETQVDGVGGVNGLSDARSVAVSPDGAHVYVAASGDNAVSVFARDALTGALSFVEVQIDGVGGVDGLRTPLNVAVSPDGAHLYVSSIGDHAVAAFARDPADGTLTFVEAEFDGVGGVDGLGGANGVAVSPDGASVYVVSERDNSVAAFSRDAVTGALTFVGSVGAFLSAGAIAVSPDGAHVYTTALNSDLVAVFARDPGTGALTLVETQTNLVGGVTGLNAPAGIVVSGDGGNVYATGILDNAVVVFQRDAGSGTLTYVETLRQGVGGVNGTRSALGIAISPDDAHVYVGGAADDAIAAFERDPGTGALTFAHAIFEGLGLDAPGGLALSGDGKHVYVAGAGDGALVVLERDAVSGELTHVQSLFDGVDALGLSVPNSIVLSPDGQHVYVAGNGVATFARSAATGTVTLLDALVQGENGVDGLASAGSIAMSPDGAHVYVVSKGPGSTFSFPDGVALLSRDQTTGLLTFVEHSTTSVQLVPAAELVLSPDGAHVYVITNGTTVDVVGIFERDMTSGTLTLLETVPFDARGTSIAMSPDGATVYVGTGAPGPETTRVYDRDGATGLLTFAGRIIKGPDVELVAHGDMVLSPAGGDLYAVDGSEKGIAHLSRDPGTGGLIYRETIRDGAEGAVWKLAMSPDGAHLYGSDATGDAVVVFGFDTVCPTSPLGGCRASSGGALKLVNRTADTRDVLAFSWLRGDETLLDDLGDPQMGATSYALCIYDDRDGGPTLIVDANAQGNGSCGAKPCWGTLGVATNPRGVLYRRQHGFLDGLTRMAIRAHDAGRAKAIVRGVGLRLQLPELPMVPPITAQIVSTEGECWSETFELGDVIRNDPPPGTVFRARKP